MRGLSLVAASGDHSSSRCAGLSLSRPLIAKHGSRCAGSVVCGSAACGIFPDQGSNPCPLHRQADSQPLRHQGSPGCIFDVFVGEVEVHIFLLRHLDRSPTVVNYFLKVKYTLHSYGRFYRWMCLCYTVWL